MKILSGHLEFLPLVTRFVAAPFMDRNVQAVKVKQIRDELKKMETKAADVSITEGNSCSGPSLGIYM